MKELQMIQSVLKAPKGQFNKFGGYKYRSCEDIVEAVKPLLKTYECVLTMSDDLVLIWDRYYIKATATLINKEWKQIITTWYAREEESKKWMDGSQITWSSSSYARKYALNGLFAIDDGVDSDKTNDGSNNWTIQKEAEQTDTSDDKEWISKEQVLALKDNKAWVTKFSSAEDMIKEIRNKYKVSKDNAKALENIYSILKTDDWKDWTANG